MILAPSQTSTPTAAHPRTTDELEQELRVLRVQLDALEREIEAVPSPSAPSTPASAVPSDAARLERRRRRAQRRAVAAQERARGLENLLSAGVHHLR